MFQFYQIPGSIRKPGVYAEFNTRTAMRGLPDNRTRSLFIGQKTAAGSFAPMVMTDVFDSTTVADYCGFGSQLHRMAIAAFKANKDASITIIALEDVAEGTLAQWPVTVAGAPTERGTFFINLNHDTLEINVDATDTPTTIAAKLVTAITARPALPFTATNLLGVVTIKAKNKGTVANSFKISAEGTVAGTTVSVGALLAGATDPDISAALTAAYLGGHNHLSMPYRDAANLIDLRDHLDNVNSYSEKRYAHGFIASNGSLGAASTLSASIGHGWINNPWLRNTRTAPMEIAAAYCATIAATEDPALPFDDVEVKGIMPPPVSDRISGPEAESALYNGVAPLYVGPGERVQIMRAVTTYTVNEANIPDEAFLDITTPRTMAYVAKAFIELRGRDSRAKLTQRLLDTRRDSGIVLMKQLEEAEIIENVDVNLPLYAVERDANDPTRGNEKIPVDVVNGLHIWAQRFDLLL